jgi:hypothetical protein
MLNLFNVRNDNIVKSITTYMLLPPCFQISQMKITDTGFSKWKTEKIYSASKILDTTVKFPRAMVT